MQCFFRPEIVRPHMLMSKAPAQTAVPQTAPLRTLPQHTQQQVISDNSHPTSTANTIAATAPNSNQTSVIRISPSPNIKNWSNEQQQLAVLNYTINEVIHFFNLAVCEMTIRLLLELILKQSTFLAKSRPTSSAESSDYPETSHAGSCSQQIQCFGAFPLLHRPANRQQARHG
jgi:hypothetical protein